MLGNNAIARIFEHCGLMTDLVLIFLKENHSLKCLNKKQRRTVMARLCFLLLVVLNNGVIKVFFTIKAYKSIMYKGSA